MVDIGTSYVKKSKKYSYTDEYRSHSKQINAAKIRTSSRTSTKGKVKYVESSGSDDSEFYTSDSESYEEIIYPKIGGIYAVRSRNINSRPTADKLLLAEYTKYTMRMKNLKKIGWDRTKPVLFLNDGVYNHKPFLGIDVPLDNKQANGTKSNQVKKIHHTVINGIYIEQNKLVEYLVRGDESYVYCKWMSREEIAKKYGDKTYYEITWIFRKERL